MCIRDSSRTTRGFGWFLVNLAVLGIFLAGSVILGKKEPLKPKKVPLSCLEDIPPGLDHFLQWECVLTNFNSTLEHLQTCSHRSKHVPIGFGMITICQNTFPSLLPLFGNGNVFWQIENAGKIGKMSLKTRFHRQNCTKKALTSLKAMLKAWKMVPQSASPWVTTFQGLWWTFLSKLRWNRPKTKKAHISVWPKVTETCFDKLVLICPPLMSSETSKTTFTTTSR